MNINTSLSSLVYRQLFDDLYFAGVILSHFLNKITTSIFSWNSKVIGIYFGPGSCFPKTTSTLFVYGKLCHLFIAKWQQCIYVVAVIIIFVGDYEVWLISNHCEQEIHTFIFVLTMQAFNHNCNTSFDLSFGDRNK